MQLLALILVIAGLGLAAIAGLWFVLRAFGVSVIWGLLCLFTGIGTLAFLILHWPVARRPFGYSLLGGLLVAAGVAIGHHVSGTVPLFG